jgi:hypothetical protein
MGLAAKQLVSPIYGDRWPFLLQGRSFCFGIASDQARWVTVDNHAVPA